MQAAGTTPQPEPRQRLVEARIQRRWSQQEVADLIGTTHVNVSRWERGITRPSLYFRHRLVALFGKSEEDLDLSAVPAASTFAPAPSALSPPAQTLAGEPIYDPAIPSLPPTPLVGREGELTRIKQRLFSGGSVALTALNGLPGIGKTALSITLAHDPQLRARFRDGVLWAALGPQPDIASQLSRWGTLLGMPAIEMEALSSSDAWAKALRLAIGPRSLLLVIDDAWKLEHALTFKVGGPNCAHLVTTRFPGIASDVAFGGAMTLQELSEDEGFDLLRLLAPGVIESEATSAHDLVHAVGGLPLALTLLGNYLRKQAYTGQERRVRAAFERLSKAEARLSLSEPQAPAEGHASLSPQESLSLQSVIAVTDQQLSHDVHNALCALSVFPPKPNSFSEEAAQAVAACPQETLDALSDAGLLESTASGRYTLHQVIADYAHLHLDESASSAAYTRLIAYMVEYVKAHRKDYELLEAESSAIQAALEAAYHMGKQTELVSMATAFAPFLLSRGIYQPAEQHMSRAHEAATALQDHYGMATTLLYLGEIAQKRGEYAQAEERLQEGLTIARGVNDPERISALLTNLGWVALKRGEYTQAEAHLQEGLTLARQLQNRERIAALLEMLGSVSGSRGDYARSEDYLQEGLTIARQLNDRERMCTILINLGVTEGEQGKHAQAEQYFEEGLGLARQIGHREWICALLSNLGEAAEAQENHTKAEIYFREGLELARQLGHREWVCALLMNLGLTASSQRKYQQAEIDFQEALILARQIGIPQLTARALNAYGRLYLDEQRPDPAEEAFTEIINILPEESTDLLALANYGMARIADIRGNRTEAQRLGKQSVDVLEAMGNREAAEVKSWLESLVIN